MTPNTSALLAASFMVLAITTPAEAQQASNDVIATACKMDVEALCSPKKRKGSKARKCLAKNQGKLSQPCRTALGLGGQQGMSGMGG
ncbi:MAG: hypothetical protein AB1749_09675, partial [Pseudomonadota bacterium]